MVFEHIDVVALALDVHVVEAWVLGECLFAVAHAVALYVGLCCDVDAVDVAEFVPAWVVGIVACADGVHVELLHDLYVLYHALY